MENKKILSDKLAAFFSKPISVILLKKDVAGHIDNFFFGSSDQLYLELSNDMVDLSERLEEGTLVVNELDELTDKHSSLEEITLDSEKKIDIGSLKFLIQYKNGNKKPSGLAFKFLNDDLINYIVVGAAPFTLVFYSGLYDESKSSEYDLSEYSLELVEQSEQPGT